MTYYKWLLHVVADYLNMFINIFLQNMQKKHIPFIFDKANCHRTLPYRLPGVLHSIDIMRAAIFICFNMCLLTLNRSHQFSINS